MKYSVVVVTHPTAGGDRPNLSAHFLNHGRPMQILDRGYWLAALCQFVLMASPERLMRLMHRCDDFLGQYFHLNDYLELLTRLTLGH